MAERRSIKLIVYEYAHELMHRSGDPDKITKLIVLETLASRAGYMDLFNEIKSFRLGHQRPAVAPPAAPTDPDDDSGLQWWQK